MDISEVLPWLYVSDRRSARRLSSGSGGFHQQQHRFFTHIVNVCGRTSVDVGALPGVSVLHVPLQDSGSSDLSSVLPAIIAFTEAARHEEGTTVLIHCEKGVNRSPVVAIAVLMAAGLTLREASTLVKERRRVASPVQSYLLQLCQFELQQSGMLTLDIRDMRRIFECY